MILCTYYVYIIYNIYILYIYIHTHTHVYIMYERSNGSQKLCISGSQIHLDVVFPFHYSRPKLHSRILQSFALFFFHIFVQLGNIGGSTTETQTP